MSGGCVVTVAPVELLLAAVASCSASDVDVATSRHAGPTRFEVHGDAHRVAQDGASLLRDLTVTYHVTFPVG